MAKTSVHWLACLVALGVAPTLWGSERLEVHESVLAAETQRIDRMAEACEATIAVFGPDVGGGGSGVIITPDGFALTNYHVTHPCGDYMRCGLPDGRLYDAVIVGLDPGGDVALIKLLGRDDFPTATLGDSDTLRPGDRCFVAGNPFVLATDFQPTVTYGIISGVHRYQPPSGTLLEYADCIQTDAAINPGNSGGPLFDMEGRLIGINGRCSFEKRGRVNVGVGYAISINQIKKFLGHLHSGRIVDHATAGFTVGDRESQAVVTNILRSSDAYRRGIRYDDQIVAVADQVIDSANAFKNVLGTYPKGWRVPITYRRDHVDVTVPVRLAGVHPGDTLFQLVAPPDRRPPTKPEDDQQEEPNPPLKPQPAEPEGAGAASEIPAAVQQRLEKRWGFANYYFSRLHLQAVLEQLHESFPSGAASAEWTIRGTVQREGPFELLVSEAGIIATVPSGRWILNDQPAYSDADLVPSGSGGLMLAIQMWQRLVRSSAPGSPLNYGELTYEGQAPLTGTQHLHDVVVGVHKTLETHYYFDPVNRRLAALEMYPDAGVDPCEIYFEYDEADPMRIVALRVLFGDRLVGVFEVESISLE